MTSLAAITLEAPEGSAWEFLVLFLVVIVGPPLMQRARVPGLIGLLIGGFLIGPHGFGLLDAGSTTIPDLGQLGLLYLMFVAGVELDLSLLKRHRNSAITFGVLTFAFPMVFGTIAGAALGWSLAASLLLGSLLASHTLVLYPLVRNAGLANDPVIASAVGATVLTDTIALVILAVIAGTESGTGTEAEIALQLVLGMAVLLTVCFVVLPRLARWSFQLLGGQRTVRYVIAVAAFLIAAVVAETFGIEGIVGAFFAGLAMNRLVPNHGPLMDRIDFFGAAVFVPVFLVSVGLLLDPSVMFEPETLGLAALFIVACMGGKVIAAQLTRPLLGATPAEANAVFGLTTPQAAATLAATTVGFQIGLFSESVVNAVLVLILVSVIVATLVTERATKTVELPPPAERALGEHVLVVVRNLDGAPLALRLAQAITEPETGVVDVILLQDADEPGSDRRAELDRLAGMSTRLGLDLDPAVRVTDHAARTVVLAANDVRASLVIAVVDETEGRWAETVSLAAAAPVAIVRGTLDEPLEAVRVVTPGGEGGAATIAAKLAEAIPAAAERVTAGEDDVVAGDVWFFAVVGWERLESMDPPPGAALVLVPDGLVPATAEGISPPEAVA
jgi:Kef-type K+ transport system membrane component KefB